MSKAPLWPLDAVCVGPPRDAHLLWLLCPQGPVRTCARTLTQTAGQEALAWPCRGRNDPIWRRDDRGPDRRRYFADQRPRISPRGKSRIKWPFRTALRAGRAGRGASKNELLLALILFPASPGQRTLSAQLQRAAGLLMSQGDKLEFQRRSAAKPEREHGNEGR